MRSKNVIIWTFVAVVMITQSYCQAGEKQAEWQDQQERLQQIESQVLVKRQQIEDRYKDQLEELQQSAEAKAIKLGHSYRKLLVQFIKMTDQIFLADKVFLTTSLSGFAKDTKDSNFSIVARKFLLDDNMRKSINHIKNSNDYKELGFFIRTEAHSLLIVMDEFQFLLTRLNKQKKDALAKLEQREKNQKEEVLRSYSDIKAQLKTPEGGVVSAIVIDGKNRLIMVNGEIVREGAMIKEKKDVKILKIYVDKVEFEKNGKTWTQKLGEIKEEFWQ